VERPSEYTLDRKNREIKELRRDNGYLADSLFRKDMELREMKHRLEEADSTTIFLGIAFAVTLIAFIILALHALTISRGT
jgi:hypothetical protein